MRILFDNDVPWPLRKHLTGHDVISAYHCGWHQEKNSELLDLAEAGRFDLLVTCDASMRFQQQVIGRKFQGQQAPVVIYSMTTSSSEDAPRGMEFLYSLNIGSMSRPRVLRL